MCKLYLGCLDSSLPAEREELLECKHPLKLFLVLEEAFKATEYC